MPVVTRDMHWSNEKLDLLLHMICMKLSRLSRKMQVKLDLYLCPVKHFKTLPRDVTSLKMSCFVRKLNDAKPQQVYYKEAKVSPSTSPERRGAGYRDLAAQAVAARLSGSQYFAGTFVSGSSLNIVSVTLMTRIIWPSIDLSARLTRDEYLSPLKWIYCEVSWRQFSLNLSSFGSGAQTNSLSLLIITGISCLDS